MRPPRRSQETENLMEEGEEGEKKSVLEPPVIASYFHSTSPSFSFCHLSILIEDVLPHDGRIKLSVLISTAFHHLECRCLINWLGNQTKHGGERKAICVFLKIPSCLYNDSLGYFSLLSCMRSVVGWLKWQKITLPWQSKATNVLQYHWRTKQIHSWLGCSLCFCLEMQNLHFYLLAGWRNVNNYHQNFISANRAKPCGSKFGCGTGGLKLFSLAHFLLSQRVI